MNHPNRDSVSKISKEIDRLYQTRLSRVTAGISPAGIFELLAAWLSHLALCPGRLGEISGFHLHHSRELLKTFLRSKGEASLKDPRFRSESWNNWPWRFYAEWFCVHEKFLDMLVGDIPGFSPDKEARMSFIARQIMDAFSPSNFIMTNPDLLAKTIETGGLNLSQGAANALEDVKRNFLGEAPVGTENFVPGKNLAITPGKVIYRNNQMELIQYEPRTPMVWKEPVLITPAWIMKYYILDLSPENSMVKWLVDRGHQVFMISWKNPGSEDRNKGMEDYLSDGILSALDVISSVVPDSRIHLAGYCLGGTLAMIATALLAHDQDTRLGSLSLFAAQGDFTEAGEITLFINDSEIAWLKNMMWEQGYLDTSQMSGAFQMIRSNDLIWSRIIHNYLMGERTPLFDLMAWNADTTRMPYKMHTEYLERLFLRNEFADGHYTVFGKTVAPSNITVPVFAAGTEKDHVAPWKSVYKIHLMAGGDVTFVLANGGHNAGIISEPGHPHRSYRIATRKVGTAYKSPDQWFESAEFHEGSWWLPWGNWLVAHSSNEQVPAPSSIGNNKYKPICDGPGTYVHQK